MASASRVRNNTESRRHNTVKRPFSARRVLRKTCFAGVVISLITGGALAALVMYSGRSLFPRHGVVEESGFFRKLRDYDFTVENITGDEAEDDERLIRLLDDLEKRALGVESHLSVLKRRRALAAGYAGIPGPGGSSVGREPGRSWSGSSAALSAYRSSAERIAAAFPHSEPLAAIAAEAAARSAMRENAGDFPGLSGATADTVRQYAAVISEEPRFAPVALSAYVLAGDLAHPGQALAVPGGEALLQTAAEHQRLRGREFLMLDAAILAVLKNNTQKALEYLRSLLDQPMETEDAEAALRFGAELLYDFGDPQRAADIFARFGDERSMARRADALVLAGQKDAARSLWTVLAAPDMPERLQGESSDSRAVRDTRVRSLYNLAALAKDADEERAALERLLALDGEHLFGIIRYTRLLPAPRAVAILEDSRLPEREALVDLELLRRRRDALSIDRTVPETWLLINRHPETEVLYEWAGYYFVFQRRYDEVPPLFRVAERKGFTGSWLDLQQALEHIRQGRLDAAEEIFTARANAGGSWEIDANLGRLLEAKRSYTAALERYEKAAALVREKPDAAKIQLRIARCFRALGQERESLRVLEYAQTLDRENLTIKLERERVEQSLY